MSREANEIAAALVAAWLKTTQALWIPAHALEDLQGRIAVALDESWKRGQADQEMDASRSYIFGHATADLSSSQEAGGG